MKNWCFAANILFDKMCDNEGSIKGALVEVINALMSALPNERKLAEQQLDALQVTEGNSFISNCRDHFNFVEDPERNISFQQSFLIN